MSSYQGIPLGSLTGMKTHRPKKPPSMSFHRRNHQLWAAALLASSGMLDLVWDQASRLHQPALYTEKLHNKTR